MVLPLAVLLLTGPVTAQPAVHPKTIFLSHAAAEGLPEMLDRLVRDRSPWVGELERYWTALKPGLRAKAEDNSLRATGSPEALAALERVIRALDVPRAAIDLSCRVVTVTDPSGLLGPEAGPPLPLAAPPQTEAEATRVRVGAGDWLPRLADLEKSGAAALLSDLRVAVQDGAIATIYALDEDEKDPRACVQARPVLMADRSTWLTLYFGRVWQRGDQAETAGPIGPAEGAPRPAVSGPQASNIVLIPELELSVLVPEGKSVLLSGLRWYAQGGQSVSAPPERVLVLTPRVGKQ